MSGNDLKVEKTFIYRHLHENDQQQFTIRSGNDTRWRSASSASPLPKWMDFGPAVSSYNRPTYAPASCTMAFTPACSATVAHYFQ